MSATESIPTRELAERAKSITQRELRTYMRAHGRLPGGHRSGPQGAAARRAVELPGLRPAPDRGAAGPRTRWMEDVDGNRYVDYDMGFGALFAGHCHPAVRAAGRAPARQRHPVRHAVRDERRRRRAARRPLRPADVAVHELGHRGHDGRHPRRPRHHRPRQDRQGRGRLPRPPRRGDDLDEAAARPGRARPTTRRRCPPPPASRPAVLADTHRHPVQRRRGARAGAAPTATSPRSSSSR